PPRQRPPRRRLHRARRPPALRLDLPLHRERQILRRHRPQLHQRLQTHRALLPPARLHPPRRPAPPPRAPRRPPPPPPHPHPPARPLPRPKHLHPRGHPDHRLPARRPPLRRLALPRRHVSTPPRPPPRPDRHPRHLGSPTRRRRPRRPRRTSAERLSPYHQCGYRQRLGPAAAQRTRPQPHLRTQVALRDRRRPHRLGRGSDPPRRLLDRQHLHLRQRRRLAALRLQIARRLRHQPHPP